MRFAGNDNIIEYNEIYNTVTETSDSGALYTGRSWTDLGNIIRYNYFHDLHRDPQLTSFSVPAVYIDDMTGGTIVHKNIFKNCDQAALFGGGKNNQFTDNYIIDCNAGVEYDARAQKDGWNNALVLPGGAVYDGLMSLINNSNYNSALWQSRYSGFAQLVSEAVAYQSNSNVDTGLPKGALIGDNRYFGAGSTTTGFDSINQSVVQYGTVNQGTRSENPHNSQDGYGDVPFSSIGTTRQSNWRATVQAAYPPNNRDIRGGKVRLLWNKSGGADYYQLVLSKSPDLSAPIVAVDEKLQYYDVDLGVGKYYWRVSAINSEYRKINGKTNEFEIIEAISAQDEVLLYEDFQGYDLGSPMSQKNASFKISAGDSLTIEEDEYGSRALKFVRNESNLSKTDSTQAVFYLSRPVSTGKIKVTYDMRIENFRSTMRNWGTVRKSSGGNIMRLFTHLQYLYGMDTSTGSYNRVLTGYSNTDYITVERVIDLDSGTYSIAMLQGASENTSSNLSCNKGDAENVLFEIGYQSPYEIYGASGDAIIWIDNIRVDSGNMQVTQTQPQNGQIQATEQTAMIKFNTPIKLNTISPLTVEVHQNGQKLEGHLFTLSAEDNQLFVTVSGGYKPNTNYQIKVKKELQPSGTGSNPMQQDYTLNFKTAEEVFVTDERITKTAPDQYTIYANISSSRPNYLLVVRECDSDDNILNIDVVNMQDEKTFFERTYTSTQEDLKFKLFFWNNFSDLKPPCKAKSLMYVSQ